MNSFLGVFFITLGLVLGAHLIFNMRTWVERAVAAWWTIYVIGFGMWLLYLKK